MCAYKHCTKLDRVIERDERTWEYKICHDPTGLLRSCNQLIAFHLQPIFQTLHMSSKQETDIILSLLIQNKNLKARKHKICFAGKQLYNEGRAKGGGVGLMNSSIELTASYDDLLPQIIIL